MFLVGEELEFRTGETDGEPTLIWRDLDGDVDETYEFIVGEGVNIHTVELFAQCMYRAMYERKYKSNSDKASTLDLQEFIWRYAPQFSQDIPPVSSHSRKPEKRAAKVNAKPSTSKSASQDESTLSDAMQKLNVKEPEAAPVPAMPESKPETVPEFAYPTLITKKAEL